MLIAKANSFWPGASNKEIVTGRHTLSAESLGDPSFSFCLSYLGP
jgi:hypothetical protein